MKGYFLILVTVFLAIGSYPAKGQERVFIPALNKHRFVNNRLIIDPFIKSSFHLNMGLGESEKVDLPPLLIGDSTILAKSGSITFANLQCHLNIRLNESVTYMFRWGFSARIGSEVNSLYSNGLNTINGIHNAWMIRLFETDKHMLSTSLGILSYNASIINLSKFVEDVISGNQGARLSQNIYVLQGFMGMHYARSFGSLLGLKLMGNFIYGDLFQSDKSGGLGTISGALDLNLYPKTRIPMGMSVGYAYTSLPEYTSEQYEVSSLFNMKLAYTGSDSFIISLDGTAYTAPYLLGRLNDDSSIITNAFNVNLNVLIYFN